MTCAGCDGDVDLYYVANARHAENRRLNRVDQDVWLTATDRAAVPWCSTRGPARSRRSRVWERQGDRVRVRVDLVPGQSHGDRPRGPGSRPVRPLSLPGRDHGRRRAASTGHHVALRGATAGTFTVTLADGRTVDGEGRTGSASRSSRRPGRSRSRTGSPAPDHRDGQGGADSRARRAGAVDDRSPGSRTSPASAATARRSTSAADWTDDDGAWLELGEVNDTFRVRVNGERLRAVRPAATPWSTSAVACSAGGNRSRSRSPPPCSTACGP